MASNSCSKQKVLGSCIPPTISSILTELKHVLPESELTKLQVLYTHILLYSELPCKILLLYYYRFAGHTSRASIFCRTTYSIFMNPSLAFPKLHHTVKLSYVHSDYSTHFFQSKLPFPCSLLPAFSFYLCVPGMTLVHSNHDSAT